MATLLNALVAGTLIAASAWAAPSRSLSYQAASGDAQAQAALGDAYAKGEGVPRDFARAFAWYFRAARAGNAAAYLPVASAYHDGRGVPRDMARALEWFARAAAAGNSVAANELAYHRAEAGGNLDAALALVDQALAREPENPHYLDTKATILQKKGRAGEAVELLRRAHAAAPEDREIDAHLKAAGRHHH